MMRTLLRLALVFIGGAIALVVLAAASGLLPFGAAGRSISPIDLLGQFGTRQSLSLRALGLRPPALNNQALVLRGAGHYETVCRNCHGAPGEGPPVPLRQMLPAPPDLLRVAEQYSAGELFQIVKHGIRMTGMPGWPARDRDDEVWSMVAFLTALPQVGAGGYEPLVGQYVGPDTGTVPHAVRTVCARCHGVLGLGRGNEAFPKLAGQHAEYLYRTLRAYAFGGRHSGIMASVASTMTETEMREAADYYSQLPGLSAAPASADVTIAAGDATPASLPDRVPRCGSCHAPGGLGNPAYPILGGQFPGYLDLQLRLFNERARGGTPFAHLMHPVADRLSEEQRRLAAAYYGGDGR